MMSFEVLWPETLSLGGGGWRVRDGVNPRCDAVGRVWPAAVGNLCDRSSFRGSAKVRYGSEGGRGLWERVLASSPGTRKSMQGNRSRDTKPECQRPVGSAVHRRGLRFRVSARPEPELPRTAVNGQWDLPSGGQ